jgi:chemotaxis protein MotA
MFIIIGFVVVFGSVLLGYTMHHGQIAVLFQVSELVIIGGAGLGAMLVGNPPSTVMATFKQCIALLKGNPYKKSTFSELLLMLYDLFQTAKRDGMLALEPHIERPKESTLFSKYPFFIAHHHATAFLADTMKVLLTGSVAQHDLAEILDLDLERHHEQAMTVSHVLAKTGDAMPGFGIVAAVLGVVVTMGSIGGAAQEIGHKVAAALVGTFLGILLAYGIFAPLAQACENIARSESEYMACVKTAILAFARGDAPATATEFARRNIDPEHRPSFSEMEQLFSANKGTQG